jgi:type II secretory pathway pseudopilin PulG
LALLSFAIGVILAAIAGIVLIARTRSAQRKSTSSAVTVLDAATDSGAKSTIDPASPDGPRKFARLPLGTFLCIGGIVAHLWGQQILAAYLQMFSL